MNNQIGAIVVLYNPNWELTEKVISNIIPQVEKVYVIDNSPNEVKHDILNHPKIQFVFLGENKGIAKDIKGFFIESNRWKFGVSFVNYWEISI